MNTLRIHTTVQTGGKLVVEQSSLRAGDEVDVLILSAKPASANARERLRGSVLRFDDPFEPAAPAGEWEACR